MMMAVLAVAAMVEVVKGRKFWTCAEMDLLQCRIVRRVSQKPSAVSTDETKELMFSSDVFSKRLDPASCRSHAAGLRSSVVHVLQSKVLLSCDSQNVELPARFDRFLYLNIRFACVCLCACSLPLEPSVTESRPSCAKFHAKLHAEL